MNRSIPFLVLLVALSLAACNKPSEEVVPAGSVGVPGPAGSQRASGAEDMNSSKGESRQSGDGSSVIMAPPTASTPAN